MSLLSNLRLPSRIAAFLAGVGMLGGMALPAQAEGLRAVPEVYQDVEAKIVRSGPTLMFSDSPEMVYENGILYRDVIKGEGRVFFHHVNGMKSTRKLSVLMRPAGKMTNITWGCRGIGDPDVRYYKCARKSQTRYFTDYQELLKKARKSELKQARKEKNRKSHAGADATAFTDYSFYGKVADLPQTTLAKGEYLEVLSEGRNTQLAGIRMKPDQLLCGMFDFHASQPVEILVMMTNPGVDIESFSRTGKELPMDEHPLRGTYEKADLTYIINKPMQVRWFRPMALCMASSDDGTFLQGTDTMSGKATINNGNYGVVYHVKFSLAGERPVKLGINPWGGIFYGTGLLLNGSKMELGNIPHKDMKFGTGYEIDDIFEISPDHKRVDSEFIWSPPGASNLPIRAFWIADKLGDNMKS